MRSKSTPDINWSKFTRSDWRPLGGKTRRYQNRETGQTISRVAWMRHYGNLGKLGFSHPEKRAKIEKRANPQRQLSRPARGRVSIRKLPKELQLELNEVRASNLSETRLLRKIKKARTKKIRYPKKISASTFTKRGAIGRTIELPISHEAIEQVRSSAAEWGNVFGYTVGVNFINTQTNVNGAYTFMRLRAINYKFSNNDYSDMLEEADGKSYLTMTSLFIYLSLDMAWAEKHRKRIVH